MLALPPHVSLRPRERLVGLIHPDFAVQLLWEAILTTLGLMLAVLATIAIDLSLARPWTGLGAGLFLTFLFLAGPLLAQRILAPRMPYVLTSARLIIDEQTEVALNTLSRIRVWPTGLVLHTSTRRYSLSHLANPAAIAQRIGTAMASEGKT